MKGIVILVLMVVFTSVAWAIPDNDTNGNWSKHPVVRSVQSGDLIDIGDNFAENEDWESARLAYLKALELEPEEPWLCYYKLAYVCLQDNRNAAARGYLERGFLLEIEKKRAQRRENP